MHDDAYISGLQRITLNASCMTISGGRTEQLHIFCRVTVFTSDFLSFIVVWNIFGSFTEPFNYVLHNTSHLTAAMLGHMKLLVLYYHTATANTWLVYQPDYWNN